MKTTDMDNPLLNYSVEELQKALDQKNEATTNNRKAYKELVDETIPTIVAGLVDVSEALATIKTYVFQSVEDLITMKQDVYGIKDDQQSHTFTTDSHSITIGYRVNDDWDDTVTAGVKKVKDFIDTLAKDADTAILVKTVLKLLARNQKGDLQAKKVLELKALADEYKKEELSDGVDIIMKSYRPTRGNWYVEAYNISNGKKTAIPLAIASVEFEPGYEFDFTKTEQQ